jgi:preprotein translocase subunit SecA
MVSLPDELPKGLDAGVHRLIGVCRRRGPIKWRLRRIAKKVEARADEFAAMSDRQLRDYLRECKISFRRSPEQPDHELVPALAALCEAMFRQTQMRPYRVQIMGAVGLYRGWLIEMATGEGKTLVATLSAVLGGWTRRPCHVITVNDYLAKRDAETFHHFYKFCGVSVGYVIGALQPNDRRIAYGRDVTYTTSKEILADFLRDRLQLGPLQDSRRRHIRGVQWGRGLRVSERLVMRGLHTAIIDEADSVLIDEAVTPLIISRQGTDRPVYEAYSAAGKLADQLEEGTHYTVDQRYKEIELTKAGKDLAREKNPRVSGLWQAQARWEELIEQALQSRRFFILDQQYVIHDDKVVIVDEYTGRMMPMRTWRDGLHQAIEVKEGLEPSNPSQTLSRLSFQQFFRFFSKLSGMTGTAAESSTEFWQIYELPVVRIPTNRPCVRKQFRDRVFASSEDKWSAVVDRVQRLHELGAPVLIGTRSVAASEELAKLLDEQGLEYNLLNAVRHAEEARMIAEAGKKGKITIATNMAGRGTDILIDKEVKELGGLQLLATERHESGRIDRQLFGRSGRQGAPGTACAFVALDDDLFLRFAWGRAARAVLRSILRLRVPLAGVFVSLLVRQCQVVAQRQAARQRRAVHQTDNWLSEALSFAAGAERIIH